jgi:hypothetical protein
MGSYAIFREKLSYDTLNHSDSSGISNYSRILEKGSHSKGYHWLLAAANSRCLLLEIGTE